MAEQLIELGLRKDRGSERSVGLLALLNRILSIIPEAAIDSERLRTSEFREELEYCRAQLSRSESPDIAGRIADLCEDYFKRARRYRTERESEYIELIEVLRDAVTRLAGESSSFNTQMAVSSERFNRLSEVDDIREIKRQIAQEVQDLKRVVAEKQQQDEANFSRLSRRVAVLQQKLSQAKEQAATDGLTKIANRGTFDRTVARWVEEHAAAGTTFVLALADIDDFKKINDTHGHQTGDRVLVCAAQWFSGSIRPSDLVARYGGEEFAVLLAGMKLAQAEPRFAELLKTIAAHCYDYTVGSQTRTIRFTASCGMVEFDAGDSVETLIERADEALYEAKKKGKNRVITRKRSLLSAFFK